MQPSHIIKAASLIKSGELVAFPTETVYGLGGNALVDTAVARIYEVKGRPSFNPLIVHVRSLEDVPTYALMNDKALQLARHFWPGPLTLVLRRQPDSKLSLLLSAGLDTVALRVPSHPLAQALLHEAGVPIAAPSANRSGRVSPTNAAHVKEEFGDDLAMILDDGPCHVGIESTVVDMSGDEPVILRPGSITSDMLEEIVGKLGKKAEQGGDIKSPGMLEKHYAPSKPLRLNATGLKPGEALLAFGEAIPDAVTTENLSSSHDLREAAANLFRMLRALDASNAAAIAVMPIPEEGLGIAINDRLKRAAA